MDKSKYKNIAVSGPIGSGKSTLAKNLAEKLGWKYISTGEFFRNWHKENNIPLEESEKIPEELDRMIDDDYKKLMQEKEGAVFESHLAGWLSRNIHTTFKVLCTAGFRTRMERTAKREKVSIDEAIKETNARAASHQIKFKNLYDVDNRFDPKYFDMVVDTTYQTPEQVLQLVLKEISK